VKLPDTRFTTVYCRVVYDRIWSHTVVYTVVFCCLHKGSYR
jgi:hypothetical protein